MFERRNLFQVQEKSTFQHFLFNGYTQDYFFQLKSASESLTTHAILCETGWGFTLINLTFGSLDYFLNYINSGAMTEWLRVRDVIPG